MDTDFLQWWISTIEPGMGELQPIMIVAFRELAYQAWCAGRDSKK